MRETVKACRIAKIWNNELNGYISSENYVKEDTYSDWLPSDAVPDPSVSEDSLAFSPFSPLLLP